MTVYKAPCRKINNICKADELGCAAGCCGQAALCLQHNSPDSQPSPRCKSETLSSQWFIILGEAAASYGTTPSWSWVNSHPQFLTSVLFWQMTRRQSLGHAMEVAVDCPLLNICVACGFLARCLRPWTPKFFHRWVMGSRCNLPCILPVFLASSKTSGASFKQAVLLP